MMSPSSSELSDLEIQKAVERALRRDPILAGDNVQAKVRLGVVELRGTVPHLLASERAMLLAESVKGVRSVSPALEITKIDREDSAIKADIEEQFATDPVTAAGKVQIEVQDGTVSLRGSVDSWVEKQGVQRLAMRVKGVREVNNQVGIEYANPRSEEEIKVDVEKRLEWDALVDAEGLKIDVVNNRVILSGTIGSAAELRRARGDAWVNGVMDVDSAGVNVDWWSRNSDRRTVRFPPRSDAEITDAIEWALTLHPQVTVFSIQPKVANAVVTLNGTVNSLDAKHAVEQIARHTTGVLDVRNEIDVRDPAQVSDEVMEASIKSALTRNVITESYEILTSVESGVATLTGTVDNMAEKAEAYAVASRTPGVTQVISQLKVESPENFFFDPYLYPTYPYVDSLTSYVVKPATPKADAKIKDDIETELFWSPFVDDKEIEVSVEEGKVTLKGTVDSPGARNHAVENAFEGGAVDVEDNLRIE